MRDHKEDMERAKELEEEFDGAKVKDIEFIEGILDKGRNLTEDQGEWLDDIWGRYLKS